MKGGSQAIFSVDELSQRYQSPDNKVSVLCHIGYGHSGRDGVDQEVHDD
jgi:hypothetical protein